MTAILSNLPIRRFAGIGLVLFCISRGLDAQFTDPRAYDSAPVGTSQLELAYVYARANASIDTSLVIAGAELKLNQGTIDYSRCFSLIRRVAWVEAIVPFARLVAAHPQWSGMA
jgi:hypothetical protein